MRSRVFARPFKVGITLFLLAFISLSPRALAVKNADYDDDDEDDLEITQTIHTAPEDFEGFKQGFGGWVELRPSWSATNTEFHSENEAALQYGLTPHWALGYTQEFTHHYLPMEFKNELEEGLDSKPRLSSGYLWTDIKNIYAAPGNTVTFSYAPRLYFPTAEWDRQAGLYAATQQYLKLNVKLNDTLDFFFYEAPLLAIHERAGFAGPNGPVANRAFENRIELGLSASFFETRLTLKFPFIFQNIRYRDFDEEATHNNQWKHLLWVYPEVLGQFTDNIAAGFGYYTDPLFDDHLTKLDISNAFRNGVVQFILQASL